MSTIVLTTKVYARIGVLGPLEQEAAHEKLAGYVSFTTKSSELVVPFQIGKHKIGKDNANNLRRQESVTATTVVVKVPAFLLSST